MSRPLSEECYQALTRVLQFANRGKGYSFGLEFTRLTIPLKAKQKDLLKKQGQRKKKPNATTAHLSRGYWYSL